ncbi:MAG: ribosomal RNA small subunit methyltransferase A [Pleurocapsa minor GSE-CHR-MK-17-07R]|jgi:16S rRNA (adenine1518-N6/adenine1519-N6)-dimethyltransferase|nr:ribosomal RNA small subunit methyltransferase A [Pleurocapsa minor GSE-CHR-MK 17-07R]
MTNPREILALYGLEPKKSLGQNFLHDPNALERIAGVAAVSADDAVLEVGPGTGGLTEALARRARRVVGVELDQRMRPILNGRLAPYDNVEIVYADILNTDPAVLMGPDAGNYVVAANVPYYITSAILRHLLETPARPRALTILMQLEVAEKLISKPGDMSLLSVSIQLYAKAKIAFRLSPGVFYPRPDVTSAVVRLDVFPQPVVDVPEKEFFRVARAGFGQKRKQIKNSLASGLNLSGELTSEMLARADIDPMRRAETLTLEEWGRLTQSWLETGASGK